MSRLRTDSAPKLSFFAFQDIITSVSGILILVVLILATDVEKASTSTGRATSEELALEQQLDSLILERNRVVDRLQSLREAMASTDVLPSASKLTADIAELKQLIENTTKQMVDGKQAMAAAEAAIREQDLKLGLNKTREEVDALRLKNEELALKDAAERSKLAELERRVGLAQSQLLRVRAREGQLWFIPEPSTDQREPILVVVDGGGITVDRFDKAESRSIYSAGTASAGLQNYLKQLSKNQQFVVFLVRPSGIELFRRLRDQTRSAGFQTGYDAVGEDKRITFGRPPEEHGPEDPPPKPKPEPSKSTPTPKSGPDPSSPNRRESQMSGTGFFITEDGYFITNEHVARQGASVSIRTAAETLPAELVSVDKANDLALLKAKGKFEALPVGQSRNVKLGTTIATVGFPNPDLQGFSPKLAKGEIGGLAGVQDDPRRFQISAPIQPGNSGGALVDERGNVIGVVVATLNQKVAVATSGTLAQNVNYAVKSSYLLTFLESVPEVYAKLKTANTEERKFEDVVAKVERATVLVMVSATPSPNTANPKSSFPADTLPVPKTAPQPQPKHPTTDSPPKEATLSWWHRILKAVGL
jgi:S1-C subfamily serine protease